MLVRVLSGGASQEHEGPGFPSPAREPPGSAAVLSSTVVSPSLPRARIAVHTLAVKLFDDPWGPGVLLTVNSQNPARASAVCGS